MENYYHFGTTGETNVSQYRMAALAFLIGVVSGVGAVVFRYMIGFLHNLLLLGRWDYEYDANIHSGPTPWGLGLIFIPVLGAVLVTYLVKNFAPEAKGHGVPEVMNAIYHNEGKIRGWVAVVKSLTSAISIGSGGSVGREGPIVQIGSAFGSLLGKLVTLPARQRVILIAAGAAGGIAATFNTPIGALAFAVELMLVAISAESMLVVGIATTVATYIGRACMGLAPAFDVPTLQISETHLIPVMALLVFIPTGIIFGLVSTIYVHVIYWFEDFFDRLPGNYYTRHCFGMFLVGVLIYTFYHFTGDYYIEGVGYATVDDILRGTLWHPEFLLLLCFAKLIATGLTIGSGASGGVFSPGLYIGATLGGAVGWICHSIMPDFPVSPIFFAITGMAGMISGATGAVLTSIIMTIEMTRATEAMLPVFFVAVIAYAVRKSLSHYSIYTLKILRRGKILPEGLTSALLSAEKASFLLTTQFEIKTISAWQHDQKTNMKRLCYPVTLVADQQKIVGIHLVNHHGADPNEGKLSTQFIFVDKEDFLPAIMRAMKHHAAELAIVVDTQFTAPLEQIIGVIRPQEIALAQYEFAHLL